MGLPEEPTSSIQTLPTDGNAALSPPGAMYFTLLQLHTHVETEKLERITLKQLVQRLQRDFALFQPHIEALDQQTTNKSSPLTSTSLENRNKNLEKCLSTETCRHNARLNTLQHQLSTMGNQICQFEHSNCTFILWKVTSIKLVIESARLWCLKPGRENALTTRLRSPVFRCHPYGYNFYLILFPYGVAAAIGTWVSLSLSISPGEYDDILPWPVSKTIQIKVRDQLSPLTVWSQTIESRELPRPTTADLSTVPAARYPYFFPHTKLFEPTNGYLHNDIMYLEISFFDSAIPPTQSSLHFPSP